MSNQKIPYIGITDFHSFEQVVRYLGFFKQHQVSLALENPCRLMVGVMMSHKTLHDLETPWSEIWIPKENIKDLFLDDTYAFNTIHYADYHNVTSYLSFLEVIGYGGEHLHALQLDMTWPNFNILKSVKNMYPDLHIILQIGNDALNQINNCPQQLVARLQKYHGAIDSILLDCSMGRGKPMDTDILNPYVKAIVDSQLPFSLGVAGGLGPQTMQLVEPLLRAYPFLSIDAQGQLRSSGDCREPIEDDRAFEYLKQALDLYKRYESV